MKRLWVYRDIDASAETVWGLLTTPSCWPDWGPSVRGVDMNDERLTAGATGRVKTVIGIYVRFEVTAFEAGSRWAWKVAGIPATDHLVKSLGPDRCRAGFGVPWPAAPYLIVCQIALRRIEDLALLAQVR